MGQPRESRASERVLVIEDDPSQLKRLVNILRDEGYEVVGCDRASKAFGYLDSGDFGVAVVDLRLPDLAEKQLLSRMQDYAGRVHLIIHTSYSSYETAKEALNIGAFAYVEKAGDLEELVRQVNRASRAYLALRADKLEDLVAEATRELLDTNDALRESEGRFRIISDMTSDYASQWRLDDKGELEVEWNSEGFEKLFGFSLGEIRYPADWGEVIHPDSRALMDDVVARTLAGENCQVELKLQTKDGEIKWINFSSRPWIDVYGKIIGINGAGKDITDLKKAEDSLKARERELEIMNRISDIFLTVAEDTLYTDVLKVVLEVMDSKYGTFGCFDENGVFVVAGATRDIFWEKCNIPDKDVMFRQGKFRGIWDRALKEKKTLYSNTGPFETSSGHVPIENTMVVPIVHQGKVISGIHIANKRGGYDEEDRALLDGIAHHIAPILDARLERDRKDKQRCLAEKALRESEEKLQTYMDGLATGVAVISPEMRILDMNKALKGWFPEIDLADNPRCYESFYDPGRDRPCSYCPTVKALADGKIHHAETGRCADGRYYMVSSAPLRDQTGKVVKVIETIQDVTDRREYQERLKATASQLSRVQELERKNLSARLHDGISQTLIATNLNLQLMARSISDEALAKQLDDASTTIRKTIEDAYLLMLELSNPILYELGLTAALKSLLESGLLKDHGIRSRLIAPQTHLELDRNTEVTLYQAVRELLVNVTRHAKAANVELLILKVGDSVRIRVKDDGIGFDPSARKVPGKGGGFGLFNLRESLGGIGGEVKIESKPQQGTIATITAPLLCESTP